MKQGVKRATEIVEPPYPYDPHEIQADKVYFCSGFDNNFDIVELFERKLAEYTDFKYAVVVDCCTNALLLSLVAKKYFNELSEDDVEEMAVPFNTYLSVPMMLVNNGWKVKFLQREWDSFYELGWDTEIYDAATALRRNMICLNNDWKLDCAMVCVSFQQKKRLSLGRGGVILFNDIKYLPLLKRLRHDGRDSYFTDKCEIEDHPNNLILGYHCYMEPEKAALGITKLNQLDRTTQFNPNTWLSYPDIHALPLWNDRPTFQKR